MSVSVEAQGIKEIMQMFNGLPKRVNKDAVWGRFWKKVTTPMLTAAVNEAPLLDQQEELEFLIIELKEKKRKEQKP